MNNTVKEAYERWVRAKEAHRNAPSDSTPEAKAALEVELKESRHAYDEAMLPHTGGKIMKLGG